MSGLRRPSSMASMRVAGEAAAPSRRSPSRSFWISGEPRIRSWSLAKIRIWSVSFQSLRWGYGSDGGKRVAGAGEGVEAACARKKRMTWLSLCGVSCVLRRIHTRTTTTKKIINSGVKVPCAPNCFERGVAGAGAGAADACARQNKHTRVNTRLTRMSISSLGEPDCGSAGGKRVAGERAVLEACARPNTHRSFKLL